VAIKWLQDNYGYDVVAVALDVGEGKDLDFVKAKALQVGAVESYVVDAKERFADEFVLPVIKANAMYENKYPLVSALSRPLISRVLVEMAEKTGATAIAHGCTGKGNDQVRFEVSIATLNPAISQHGNMGQAALNVFLRQFLIEADGSRIFFHKLVGSFGKTSSP